ncbi:MAG: OmpA family protein [Pseudomonadota bacterium]
MKLSIIAIGCIMLTSQAAQAQAQDDFLNPDWANKAWYIGAGLGQGRATIDKPRLERALQANGDIVTLFTTDQRDLGVRLFVGKQINRYLAVEGGYTDLGDFSFNSRTTNGGALKGEAGFRSLNLDLVGQLPLGQRFSILGRAGVNYTRTNTSFSGNRLAGVTSPGQQQKKAGPSLGLGLEYKFSEALAVRAEAIRSRVNDAVGNRGDVDLYVMSLVHKLGRPAAAAFVPAAPAPAPAPVAVVEAPAPAPVVMAAPVAKSAPVPTSEKVSFAAEALFDFDKSIVKPQGKAALDDLLAKLKGMNTEVMVTVGHTDAIGSDEYNQKLSQRRAEAVKAYIVSKGIDGSRVYTEGKGESQSVADNTTSEGRAKNRRVTVEVVGTRQ